MPPTITTPIAAIFAIYDQIKPGLEENTALIIRAGNRYVTCRDDARRVHLLLPALENDKTVQGDLTSFPNVHGSPALFHALTRAGLRVAVAEVPDNFNAQQMNPTNPNPESPKPPAASLEKLEQQGSHVTATFVTEAGQKVTRQFVVRPLGAGKRGPLKGQLGIGRPKETQREKLKVNGGISMRPADWQLADQLRGDESRGDLFARLMHEEQARRSAPAKH